jgi:curved DNA-binding protein CbpA
VNHYERLKVSRDAPIEVIRAAYRALAAKHHPDRHTQPQSSHADMAALNAAYETLANASTRATYDAELADAGNSASQDPAPRKRSLWRSTMGLGSDTVPADPPEEEFDESRVDVQWQAPPPTVPDNPWMNRTRLVPLASVLGVVAVAACGWWIRDAFLQMQAEQTLSRHYDDKVQASGGPQRHAAITMTDEELLAEPPPLAGQPAVAATRRVPQENHLLDGTPLTLRQETSLVDPLSLPSAAHVPARP